MKYSFIMPICFRNNQFYNTMLSFAHWYKDRTDYEIILVEDIKNSEGIDHKPLMRIIKRFKNEGINIRLVPNKKRTVNPTSHYNLGIRMAKGEYIIITNPECFHKSDILTGFDELFDVNPNYYIVCACESGNVQDGARIDTFEDGMTFKNELWYQHSVHRNANLHFCSSMSKKNYNECGGFDEIFSDGYAVEDLDLLDNIYESETIMPCPMDDLIVYHQYHKPIRPRNWLELNHHNKMVYYKKRGRMPNSPVPPPKDIT